MVYETEEQQVEAIKKWWNENGSAIITGVLVAVVAVGGYKFWTKMQITKIEKASSSYDLFLDDVDKKAESGKIISQGEEVIADYGDTEYAVLTALMLAKTMVEQRDYDKAADYLRWAIENGHQENTILVSRLRLGRILFQQEKYQEVLDVLEGDVPMAFAPLFIELQGDSYYRQGNVDKARSAYMKAMELVNEQKKDRSVLKMKLENLAVQP